jgi:hypothetical protein
MELEDSETDDEEEDFVENTESLPPLDGSVHPGTVLSALERFIDCNFTDPDCMRLKKHEISKLSSGTCSWLATSLLEKLKDETSPYTSREEWIKASTKYELLRAEALRSFKGEYVDEIYQEMKDKGMTIYDVAENTRISYRRLGITMDGIQDILDGKRPITTNGSAYLAIGLNVTNHKYFYNQYEWFVRNMSEELEEKIKELYNEHYGSSSVDSKG